MKLNINLASQPYQDAQRFWMQWGIPAAVLSALTLVLLYTTFSGWMNAHRDRKTIAGTEAAITKCDRERSQAEAKLNQAENRILREQSQTINELIRRKAFSWTQVFADLEKMMPPQLHVVSIHPELTGENELEIKMTVAGQSRDRALDLVEHMEHSPRFRQPLVREESTSASQTAGDTVQFEISAGYIPEIPRSHP